MFGVFKFLMDYTFNQSLEDIPVSLATLLQNTAPYFVVILSYLFFREKTTKIVLLSIMIGTFGCALMTGNVMAGTKLDFMGIVFALISAFSLGMYFIGSDRSNRAGYSPVNYLFYVLLVAMIIAIPFADLGKITSNILEPGMVGNSLALGIGMTLIPFYIMTWSAKYLDAPTVSMICVLEIVFATFVGAFYFNETIGVQDYVGMALMIISIYIIGKESIGGEKNPTEMEEGSED